MLCALFKACLLVIGEGHIHEVVTEVSSPLKSKLGLIAVEVEQDHFRVPLFFHSEIVFDLQQLQPFQALSQQASFQLQRLFAFISVSSSANFFGLFHQ